MSCPIVWTKAATWELWGLDAGQPAESAMLSSADARSTHMRALQQRRAPQYIEADDPPTGGGTNMCQEPTVRVCSCGRLSPNRWI